MMKILVISDHFYPDIHGGYEVGCSRVTMELRKRGYDISVLTTTCQKNRIRHAEEKIFRDMPYVWIDTHCFLMDMILRQILEIVSFFRIKRFFQKNHFDLLYLWSVRGFFTTSFQRILSQNVPVCGYLFDDWTNRFDQLAPYGWYCHEEKFRFWKKILKLWYPLFGLDPLFRFHVKNPQFCSSLIRQKFLKEFKDADGPVIPFGIQSEKYPFDPLRKMGKEITILFAGRLCPEKGLAIAMEAVVRLRQTHTSFTFDIYGGFDRRQREYLDSLLKKYGNPPYVRVMGTRPMEEMPQIMSRCDICLFSSIWEEPYGLVPLEAMATGAVVVSSGDGGSIDFSFDGKNCLLYDGHSSKDCAEKLRSLMDSPKLWEQIRIQAREFIETEMRFQTTVDQIERCLKNALSKNDHA